MNQLKADVGLLLILVCIWCKFEVFKICFLSPHEKGTLQQNIILLENIFNTLFNFPTGISKSLQRRAGLGERLSSQITVFVSFCLQIDVLISSVCIYVLLQVAVTLCECSLHCRKCQMGILKHILIQQH